MGLSPVSVDNVIIRFERLALYDDHNRVLGVKNANLSI